MKKILVVVVILVLIVAGGYLVYRGVKSKAGSTQITSTPTVQSATQTIQPTIAPIR